MSEKYGNGWIFKPTQPSPPHEHHGPWETLPLDAYPVGTIWECECNKMWRLHKEGWVYVEDSRNIDWSWYQSNI